MHVKKILYRKIRYVNEYVIKIEYYFYIKIC